MSTIELAGVTKAWGGTVAVDDVSFTVEEGSFVVLLGPSGCGKSTTLRMIAGLETVSAGRVLIAGRDVTDRPPSERNISMVFQSYALFPHLDVAENIVFGLRVRKTPAAERDDRLARVAETVGLSELLDRKAAQLSGGQRQRVALARAIIAENPICLMDEPLSNLDAKLRVQTRAELIRLHDRLQTTVVYVTHDQIEAMTMGTRIAVLDFGVLQQVDTPQNLYHHPANQFVAGFIGSPAMNLFDGKLVTVDGTTCCQVNGFNLKMDKKKEAALAKLEEMEMVFAQDDVKIGSNLGSQKWWVEFGGERRTGLNSQWEARTIGLALKRAATGVP